MVRQILSPLFCLVLIATVTFFDPQPASALVPEMVSHDESCPTTYYCYAAGWTKIVNSVDPVFSVTTDGANTWTRKPVPSNIQRFTALYCASTYTCLASAVERSTTRRMILRTRDGGNTWTDLPLPASIANNTTNIYRIECSGAWSICRVDGTQYIQGFVLTTTTVGDSWTMTTITAVDAVYDTHCFVYSLHCAAIGHVRSNNNSDRTVWLTSDNGGSSWQPHMTFENRPNMSCVDKRCVITVVENSSTSDIFVTNDAGATWSKKQYATRLTWVGCMSGGDNCVINLAQLNTWDFYSSIVTHDGGLTWHTRTGPPGDPRFTCPNVSSNNATCIAHDAAHQYLTVDGGDNWVTRSTP